MLGADHAGFALKQQLGRELRKRGVRVIDVGTHSAAMTDYPKYCIAAATAVAEGHARWAIVVGGSGQGEQIAANKVPGIRAALCHDPYVAVLARRHNDANVLAIGARFVAAPLAIAILDAWMKTRFDGGRHRRRIDQIAAYEQAPRLAKERH